MGLRVYRVILLLIMVWFSLPALAEEGCAFCNRTLHLNGRVHYHGFQSPPNTTNFFSSLVVDESEHFVLKVTRGAFTPFYFLIISKEHFNRVGDLPTEYFADLEKFKAKVESFYREVLETKFVVFEHGSHVCSDGGACVDHLHLHILPFAGEIENHPDLRLKTRFHPPKEITELSQLKGREDSYIFYQNPEGQLKVYGIIDWVPSQLLRLLIAEAQGFGEEYNWRDFEDRGDFMANAAHSIGGYQDWRLRGAKEAARRIAEKNMNTRVSGGSGPLIFSGECEDLLARMDRFKAEVGEGSLGEFSQWIKSLQNAFALAPAFYGRVLSVARAEETTFYI